MKEKFDDELSQDLKKLEKIVQLEREKNEWMKVKLKEKEIVLMALKENQKDTDL